MFGLRHVARLCETADAHPIELRAQFDAFLFDCRARNLSPTTINGYAERLRYFFIWFNGTQVTKQDLQQYVISLLGQVSDVTVNGRITVFKLFWGFLKSEGYIETDPAADLKKIKAGKKIKTVVTEAEINKILSHTDKRTYYGYRNYLMVLTLWDTMIRRNELLTLTWDRIDIRSGLLTVYGKGNKERLVPMGPKLQKALHYFGNKHRRGDLVFCTQQGGQLDKDNVRQIIWRMGQRLDIWISPHLIRHSSATWFIRNGGSPAILQKIMGHSSPVITAQYTHLNPQDLVDCYKRWAPSGSLQLSR